MNPLDQLETLHGGFEAQVRRTPTAVALSCQGSRLSYSELNQRANQVAHHLRRLGVGPDVLVGLFFERSIDLVVALLGILKAGGAYLPIEPAYPKDRIGFMLEDAQVKAILTEDKLANVLPVTGARVLRLDHDRALFEAESRDNPASSSGADNLAYVIFTSGSTGKPKGALVTHHNVVRLMESTQPWFQFNAQDVWTYFHSPAFDFSVWELWGALLYGGRVVMVPYLVTRSPEDFYQLLVRERVTVLNQTPAAFRQLMRAEERLGQSPDLALRYVIFGGEALEMQSLKPWFQRHGDKQPQLVNMYGITETTVHVTYRPLGAADVEGGSVIGVPIPDLQVHILDEHQRPVPRGETGEMYVGGAGVVRGYLNRPELTAARFLPDPFSAIPAARLYRTGDLGRFLKNGDLEYLGRCDNQVKIRGFRMELGEIESTYCSHPLLRECVVLARGEGDDKRLVAYLAAHSDAHANPTARPSQAELRSFAAAKLPDYMIPSKFIWLKEMPLTPHGKVDRRALPEHDPNEQATPYVAPVTKSEEILVGLWQRMLGLARVSTTDKFFEIGGTSLMVVRVHQQLEDALARKVPITLFFEHPTIAQLARHLDGASDHDGQKAVLDRAARQRQFFNARARTTGA